MTSCFLQRLCPGTPFPGQEKNGTSRGMTRAQTAQTLLTKEKSPGLGVSTLHEL